MLLPAQHGRADADAVMLLVRISARVRPRVSQKPLQRRAVGFRLFGIGLEREMQRAAGVASGVKGRACTSPSTAARKRMRLKPGRNAVTDGDVRAHLMSRRMLRTVLAICLCEKAVA